MKRFLVMMTLVASAAGAASAADLPRQMPVTAPAYYAPAPFYNWTGVYVGINGGGGWGTSDWNAVPTSFDVSGAVVGGTVGYNWQFGTWVAGVEGDLDWSNIKGSTNATVFCALGCETRNDYLGTVRGRLGYAFDRFLPYVTGGLAVGNVKASYPGFASVNDNNLGWTVGAGVEFAVGGNVTAKVEYLYVDLGDITCGLGTSCINPAVGNKVDFNTNLVRGGLNFRF